MTNQPSSAATATKPAGDPASDGLNVLKTGSRWPAFRLALAKVYRETKTDLFSFSKSRLEPEVRAAIGQINAAMELGLVPEKTDRLLATKWDTREKLSGMDKSQSKKAAWAGGAFYSLLLLGMVTGTVVLPLIAIPVLAVAAKFLLNGMLTHVPSEIISDKADREIMKYIVAKENAFIDFLNAPEIQKMLPEKGFLKKTFTDVSWLHWKEEDYQKLASKMGSPAAAAVPGSAPRA